MIVQPVVEPMDRFAALVKTLPIMTLPTDRDLLPLDGPPGLYEGGLVHAVGGPALPGQGVAQRRAQPVSILFVVLQ